MALNNPYSINKSYQIAGMFFSHTLNGIRVFVKPNSPEGEMIGYTIREQYKSTKNERVYQTDKFHNLIEKQREKEKQRILNRFKKWNKERVFEWDT